MREMESSLGSGEHPTLLAKSTIKSEDARNPVRHLGWNQGFLPSVAVQIATSEFANSVSIRTENAVQQAIAKLSNSAMACLSSVRLDFPCCKNQPQKSELLQ